MPRACRVARCAGIRMPTPMARCDNCARCPIRSRCWSPTASSAWMATSRRCAGSRSPHACSTRRCTWTTPTASACSGRRGAAASPPRAWASREVPLQLATLGKALGGYGAVVLGDDALIQHLAETARPYLYTTALPPAQAAASLAAVRIARKDDWRRDKLHALIGRLREGAARRGFELLKSETPIQPLICGDDQRAVALAERPGSARLLGRGDPAADGPRRRRAPAHHPQRRARRGRCRRPARRTGAGIGFARRRDGRGHDAIVAGMSGATHDARRGLAAIGVALLAALFFTFTYVLNRAMASAGGHWAWTASLRYLLTLPMLLPLMRWQGGAAPVWRALRAHPLAWLALQRRWLCRVLHAAGVRRRQRAFVAGGRLVPVHGRRRHAVRTVAVPGRASPHSACRAGGRRRDPRRRDAAAVRHRARGAGSGRLDRAGLRARIGGAVSGWQPPAVVAPGAHRRAAQCDPARVRDDLGEPADVAARGGVRLAARRPSVHQPGLARRRRCAERGRDRHDPVLPCHRHGAQQPRRARRGRGDAGGGTAVCNGAGRDVPARAVAARHRVVGRLAGGRRHRRVRVGGRAAAGRGNRMQRRRCRRTAAHDRGSASAFACRRRRRRAAAGAAARMGDARWRLCAPGRAVARPVHAACRRSARARLQPRQHGAAGAGGLRRCHRRHGAARAMVRLVAGRTDRVAWRVDPAARVPSLAMLCASPRFVRGPDWKYGVSAEIFQDFADGPARGLPRHAGSFRRAGSVRLRPREGRDPRAARRSVRARRACGTRARRWPGTARNHRPARRRCRRCRRRACGWQVVAIVSSIRARCRPRPRRAAVPTSHVIEHAGHAPFLTHADDVASRLASFLERCRDA